MEEKNQNSLTINDILNQLAKPSVLQKPEMPVTRPNTPPLNTQPPLEAGKKSEITLPSLGKESNRINPQLQPSLSSPPELKLFIRTMSSDIERLKQGQKPSVLEVPKIITKSKPLPSTPPPARQAPLTPPMPQTREQILGSVRPAQPLPPITRPPIYSPPSPPPVKQPQYSQEHFHPEKVISQGDNIKIPAEDTLPQFLGAPVPKKEFLRPEKEKVEYSLIARIVGSGMTTGIVGTILVAVVAYFAVYYFFFNQKNEVATPTNTPSPTSIVSSPQIDELDILFKNIPILNFKLVDNQKEAVSGLKSFIESQTLTKKEFKILHLTDTANQEINFTNALAKLSVKIPSDLMSELNNNSLILIYGQEELLSKEGGLSGAASASKRFVFIAEINNLDRVSAIMRMWEQTMANDFKDLFSLDSSKAANQNFLENERQGIKIRYKNFPLPDKTIDYTIASPLTGKHYLIITNSRESMYSPIDRIRGL